MPELWELDKIYKMDSSLLEIRKENKRLVIWVIANTPDNYQRLIAEDLNLESLPGVESRVWACLEALKSPEFDPDHIPNAPERHRKGRCLIRLTSWFLTWITCQRYLTYREIPATAIEAALANPNSFKHFFHFLLKYFPESARQTPQKRQREAESSGTVPRSGETSGVAKKQAG